MNLQHNDQEMMENYVMGRLDETAVHDFEQRLQNEPKLQEGFNEYKLLVAGIKFSGRHQLQNRLKAIEREFSEKPAETKTVRLIHRKFYYIAASLAAIVVSAVLIFQLQGPSPQQLAQSYFSPYPTTIGAATRSMNQPSSALSDAMNNFEAGNYDKSIELLKALPPGKNTYIIKFYLANAYQAKGSFPEAEKIYSALQQQDGELQTQVSWYLSLCYLEQKKTDLARNELQRLKEGNSSYKLKATQLLDKID